MAEVVRNQRMINSTSVGVIYVGGSGEYAISNAEKIHILAEVTAGLDDLASNEPDANITWNFSTLSVNLPDLELWKGARWPGMNLDFYKGIDAALWSESNQRIYFFKGSKYYRINPNNDWKADAGYPKDIAGNWPGLPASFTSGIDAAFWAHTTNKVYMFKGSQYVRIDPNNGWQMEAGYPKPIAGNWPGFPADFAGGVDAAMWTKKNDRIYFFKGDQYIRVNPSGWAVEAGYPKPIKDNWPGLPDNYNEGIDAALWSDTNKRVYLFKKGTFWEGTYVRINPDDGWKMEADYPKPIGLSASETEALWRDPAQEQLGHATGSDGIWSLTDALQNGSNSQFGYLVFFTKLPTMWFAYAGGKVIMRKSPPGSFTDWTSIDNVFAHETGHIFGAPDEYASSKCKCDSMKGKFFSVPNGNCQFDSCAESPTGCLMISNTPTILCPFTPYHFGWGAFMTGIDDAIYSFKNDKIYMFSKDYYVRFTKDYQLEEGYPKPIKGNWPGFPDDFAAGIDAAVYAKTNNRIYFFKGNQYIRVNPNDGWKVESGYPKPIAGNWSGFPTSFASGVDAALWSEKTQRVYFFKGSQYVRVNPDAGWAVEAGYPKPIAGNWPGFPADFAAGVDGALWGEDNKRVYIFKGTRYLRVNPDAGWAVEGGYPKHINKNWKMPFPAA
jgi:hypothetical protein